MNWRRLIILCVPLTFLFLAGIIVSGIADGADWLNRKLQQWFEDIWNGGRE